MFKANRIWIAAAIVASAGSVSAQEKVKLSLSTQRAVQSAGAFGARPSFEAPSKPRAAYRPPNSTRTYEVGGLKLEKQRTAFLNQVRVPVASFWNGRVQLAGMQQRVRDVNAHSAVSVADPAAAVGRTPFGVITPHRQATYGGGIWLQIGRTRETAVETTAERTGTAKESR